MKKETLWFVGLGLMAMWFVGLMPTTILVLYWTGLVLLFTYFNLRASKKPTEERRVDIEVDYGDPMDKE